MNNNNPYPYSYAMGSFKGLFGSLYCRSSIPGVEVTDWRKFKEFLESEEARIEADIKRFQKTGEYL